MPVALRMDDVGACSKRYEVYSNHALRIAGYELGYGNWLFLKYIEPFRKWGPYREMTVAHWHKALDSLARAGARLTVGVTAAWAESEHTLIPFPERFPAEAAVLKQGVDGGLIEVANHGLTHCVLADNAFRPRLFSGNRRQHREFWEWLSAEVHDSHVARSQNILRQWLGRDVVTFVPPGNVFASMTVKAAVKNGLRYLSCQTKEGRQDGMIVVGNNDVIAFHDRDIVLNDGSWLDRLISHHKDSGFVFIRELGERMEQKVA